MRSALAALATCLLCLALAAPPAGAAFGFKQADVTFTNADGSTADQAGAHPFAMSTTLDFNTHLEGGKEVLDAPAKDLIAQLPPGFVGDPDAVPVCQTADFLLVDGEHPSSNCPDSTALGVLRSGLPGETGGDLSPAFNLAPSPGSAAKIGLIVIGVPVVIQAGVNPEPPYNLIASLSGISNAVAVGGSELTLWGNPLDPAHDSERGSCLGKGGSCDVSLSQRPFLTLPRSCRGPLATIFEADSWEEPGVWARAEALTHDQLEPPAPLGMQGCDKLDLAAAISAQPTSKAATSPTGLDFDIDVQDEGLRNPEDGASAGADIEKAVVTLPQGMTVNPSQAEGLAVCSEAQLEAETPFSAPGQGCPNASKIGSLEVETPVLENKVLKGSLFVAKPYENLAGDSLLALYIVIKDPTLGIVVKQPARVEPDPVTGRLTTTAEDMPQLPFSHFRLHFKEGARSPLVTPPACGPYTTTALLYPSSGNPPVSSTSTFEVISGPDNSPCPKGGLPPFHPELLAGSRNNAAGRFSPFDIKITRTDTEQELTHFSIKLPPGVTANLSRFTLCPEAGIAAAKAREGTPHGGAEELAAPSCPASSQIGHSLAGSGVGGALTYVPGKIYMAGPYHGHPISVVAITSAVAGPFDLGTVVVRLAIDVNPETGEVFLDSTGSDPIPHIIRGIPVHLRDIRAYDDAREHVLNPTSCARKSTAATVLGSGLDFVSAADDNPFVSTSPFQAADCAALPFEPKLTLRLLGGTKRGAYPKLKALLRMHGIGEAGVARAQVTLPRSEFIANAHFQTICTRVQFKAMGGNGEACPAGSIYGWARAKTPILAEPLEGPVFLRSSEHELPDVVASLGGQQIDVHLVGHVDSVKGKLRNTFEAVPDAPVEWASFSFKGGRKGLFENSTDLCVGKHRADVRFIGQNGKRHNYKPAVKVKCAKGLPAARARSRN